MVSVIIPTRNAERTLAATLTALVPAMVDGVIREVLIVDSQSTDRTEQIANAAGARILDAPQGRGRQLKAGGEAARHDWLLFLHADTVLEDGWHNEVSALIETVESGGRSPTAAFFRFALDDNRMRARIIESGVNLRSRACAMPYGDQGLLISRGLYDEIGGFKPMAIFEDVDIIRRLGRRRLVMMRSKALTNARRFKQRGYSARVLRNWTCVALYYLGTPTERIEKIYNG